MCASSEFPRREEKRKIGGWAEEGGLDTISRWLHTHFVSFHNCFTIRNVRNSDATFPRVVVLRNATLALLRLTNLNGASEGKRNMGEFDNCIHWRIASVAQRMSSLCEHNSLSWYRGRLPAPDCSSRLNSAQRKTLRSMANSYRFEPNVLHLTFLLSNTPR